MSSAARQADPYARAAAKFALSCKLASIEALIDWDAQTNMPKGGSWARGEQRGALAEVMSDLTGTAEIGVDSIRVPYSGDTCLGKVSGVEVLRKN